MNTTFKLFSISSVLLAMPLYTFAQESEEGFTAINNIFTNILVFIDETLIPFVFAIALITFLYGVFKYFILGGADTEKRTEGKQLVLYAIIGFVLMSSIFGIVNLIVNGLSLNGIEKGEDTLILPDVPTRDSEEE